MFGLSRIQTLFVATLLFLSFVFVVVSAMNAETITAIRVKIKDPSLEHHDKTLFGLGKGGRLPDYRMRLRVNDSWYDLGTKPNQSAANWLEFPVKKNAALRSAQEIELREAGALESDTLDRVQIGDKPEPSEHFDYELVTSYKFETGMAWFFGTDLGKAILVGIALAIVIVVVMNFA